MRIVVSRTFRWFALPLVLLAVLAVVAVRWLDQVNDAQELERDLRIHTGGSAGEDAYDLAHTLIEAGVSQEDAVDVAAALNYVGGDLRGDLSVARLLAVFEQASHGDARPSTDLMVVAEQLEVDSDGLRGFLNLVIQESIDRQVPVDVMAAGLYEHGFEYAHGCEVVERAPCSVEVVVELTLDRQHSDYERWGYTDCRLDTNVAHPGCLTFPDCADEYAFVHAAQDAEIEAWERARALGHEPGSAGWEEWTGAVSGSAQSSWDAHASCVAERYGEGNDAYKALVLLS